MHSVRPRPRFLPRKSVGRRPVRQDQVSDFQFDIDLDALGDRLFEAVDSLIGGDSIRDVAHKTGLSVGVVTRLVDRKHMNRWPSVFVLERLAVAYGKELVLGFE